MTGRLKRHERTERNRALVLEAARRVFLERGYHGASLDQIADAAGFSKGVVYSQFRGKGDLFLALLEARIEERAASNARVVAGLGGADALTTLLEHFMRSDQAQPGWGLLVIEFRVHAARDPELNRRYAALHERTLGELAEVVSAAFEAAGEEHALPPRQMAEALLSLSSGFQLEHAVDPDALGGERTAALLARLITRSERTPA